MSMESSFCYAKVSKPREGEVCYYFPWLIEIKSTLGGWTCQSLLEREEEKRKVVHVFVPAANNHNS